MRSNRNASACSCDATPVGPVMSPKRRAADDHRQPSKPDGAAHADQGSRDEIGRRNGAGDDETENQDRNKQGPVHCSDSKRTYFVPKGGVQPRIPANLPPHGDADPEEQGKDGGAAQQHQHCTDPEIDDGQQRDAEGRQHYDLGSHKGSPARASMGRHPDPRRRRSGKPDRFRDCRVVDAVGSEIYVVVVLAPEQIVFWRAFWTDQHVIDEADVHVVRQELRKLAQPGFKHVLIGLPADNLQDGCRGVALRGKGNFLPNGSDLDKRLHRLRHDVDRFVGASLVLQVDFSQVATPPRNALLGKVAADPSAPSFARASALTELASRLSPANIGLARAGLSDPDPMVRIGALDIRPNRESSASNQESRCPMTAMIGIRRLCQLRQ
jgi:hypothetical protein